MKLSNKVQVLIIILILIAIGFWRDNLFVNLNRQYSFQFYNSDVNYTLPFYQKLFDGLTVQMLYYLKWIFTVVFTIIYYLLSLYILKLLTKNYHFWTITLTYIVFTFVAALCYIVGSAIGELADGYKLSRTFMGLLQSPIIIMVIAPILILYNQQKLSK